MEQETAQTASNQSVANTDKSVAIISYLSIIGWIIAYVMYGNNKTALGAYHLRQTIALFIIGICCWILQMFLMFIPYIGWALDIVLFFVYIGLFVLWVIGFAAAINGQKKPMPLIGTKAQQWFEGIK